MTPLSHKVLKGEDEDEEDDEAEQLTKKVAMKVTAAATAGRTRLSRGAKRKNYGGAGDDDDDDDDDDVDADGPDGKDAHRKKKKANYGCQSATTGTWRRMSQVPEIWHLRSPLADPAHCP